MSEDKEEEKKVGLIELDSLKDLVHLIANTPFHTIDHMELKKKHYYFLIVGGLPGFTRMIYFYRQDEPIKENFIIYNNLQDMISFGDKMEARGGITYLPIIHIKNQNIIKPEDITF